MWPEIWQQFGKPAMQGLGGVAHGDKDINAMAGLPAQKTSVPLTVCCVSLSGKWKGVRWGRESSARCRGWLMGVAAKARVGCPLPAAG